MTSSECKQNMHKHTPIIQTSINKLTSKPKITFFIANYKTPPSLEVLNNSLAELAGKLWLGWNTPQVSICGGRRFSNFLFYSHNFGSRYASKPINSSEDLDDSIDSKIT